MLLPGSEIATKNSPGCWSSSSRSSRAASTLAHASAWNASGSVVVPDLLATIQSVSSGSRSSTVAATAAGSVESRMRSAR